MSRSSSLNERVQFSMPRLKRMFQFGGSLLKNSHAKKARPLSTRLAMHVVLKSSQAKGEWSLKSPRHHAKVEDLLRTQARKFGIKIYEFANAGDHLHIVLQLRKKKSFAPFIRALTGSIALKVTGSNKLQCLHKSFWDFRPWTRLLSWTKSYALTKDLEILNHLKEIKLISLFPQSSEGLFWKKAPS